MALNLFKKNKPKRPSPEVDLAPAAPSSRDSEPQGPLNFGSGTLKGAHVTEKAGFLNGFNQYVFKVSPRANKIEIKKAVEKMYGVKVDRVMVMVMPSKKRRLGWQEGERGGFKKAIVKLVAGHKIDVMPK